jgi:hypothetical protein
MWKYDASASTEGRSLKKKFEREMQLMERRTMLGFTV